MPQLDPTWFASQLFWLAITFVTLYVVLSRFVLPPLLEIIARRAQTAQDDMRLMFAHEVHQQTVEAKNLDIGVPKTEYGLFFIADYEKRGGNTSVPFAPEPGPPLLGKFFL